MTGDLDEMKTRVRHCLMRSVPADLSLQNVSDDTHLFDEAVLDSLSTVALFSEIETEFQIKLKEDDVFSTSFTTIGGIAELVEIAVSAPGHFGAYAGRRFPGAQVAVTALPENPLLTFSSKNAKLHNQTLQGKSTFMSEANTQKPGVESTSRAEMRSSQRVNQWKGVWDLIYRAGARGKDPAFNIAGWQSSYERKPIAAEAMADWVQNTVASIRELEPSRVLEIGCGTGLLLQRLAPDCAEYWGIDVSAESIKFLQGLGMDSERVHLLNQSADRLQDLPPAFFDTVVINSVIQYFPNADYLLGVLRQIVGLLSSGGAIFLGDVRHFGLLETFVTEVVAHQSGEDVPIAQLKEDVEEKLAQERELQFDPRFFSVLKREIPAIRHAEVRLKGGHHLNELTKYRYDVVLYVGSRPLHGDVPTVRATGHDLEKQIENERPTALRLAGVSNTRLNSALETLKNLDSVSTVGELRTLVSKRPQSGSRSPQEWIDWSCSRGYRAMLSWVPGAADGSYDILLEREGEKRSVWDCAPASPDSSLTEFVNNPLGG